MLSHCFGLLADCFTWPQADRPNHHVFTVSNMSNQMVIVKIFLIVVKHIFNIVAKRNFNPIYAGRTCSAVPPLAYGKVYF